MDWILLVIGIYFISFSLIMSTDTIKLSILFKVIPFFSGLFLIIYFLFEKNIFTI